MNWNLTIKEEELKNKVAQFYFPAFDCTKIIGNVDFCVTFQHPNKTQKQLFETESLLWAEAKKGKSDIYNSLVQLILTIGKARTFDKTMPPAYLGAFDAERIAFIPYNDIHEIFYLTDFNWNVTPSNYGTKEFLLVHEKVKATIDSKSLLFRFGEDDGEIADFVKTNFISGKSHTSKIKIDKNNFMIIYNKWLSSVKPSIGVDWEDIKKDNIIDGDFYLADILSQENETLKDKLFVLLKKDYYKFDRKLEKSGRLNFSELYFKDNQKAHTQFWNKYERPPKEEYWDYIVERRDLLVPQDVRERKGSFFTPQIWVELSQKYIADVLGPDWQDEYYVWDCAAGTGNLLTGLVNKYNVWASTLDRQDVDVMKDRIKNGTNLLEDHVFQFDFLNDDFTKLPLSLQKIINDPEKRKKLVIYINPPYAESNGKISISRSDVQVTKIYAKYSSQLEKVGAELFAQFLARIYFEIPDCIIAEFSKSKILNGTNSLRFRSHFLAKLEKCFMVPANTFDNVKGQFPIGFFIWDTKEKEKFSKITADVYGDVNNPKKKNIYSYDDEKGRINDWLSYYKNNKDSKIGYLMADGPDFQNNNYISILNEKGTRHGIFYLINQNNLIIASIYLAVRQVIDATWLNDRDQFLYPNEGWESDTEFQNDCFAFTLFHGQNRITASSGTNHWIPFTETEVNARERFDSHFMTDFMKGKINYTPTTDLFNPTAENRTTALAFSDEAMTLFAAGRALWKYYHTQPDAKVNAALYDIREHFQGRNEAGKMNNKSEDAVYTKLIGDLRFNLKILAKKLEPKVYAHGFLKV